MLRGLAGRAAYLAGWTKRLRRACGVRGKVGGGGWISPDGAARRRDPWAGRSGGRQPWAAGACLLFNTSNAAHLGALAMWAGERGRGVQVLRLALALARGRGPAPMIASFMNWRWPRRGRIKLLRPMKPGWVPISLSETNPGGLAAGSRWSARRKGADHRVNADPASCTQKGCQPVFDLTRTRAGVTNQGAVLASFQDAKHL